MNMRVRIAFAFLALLLFPAYFSFGETVMVYIRYSATAVTDDNLAYRLVTPLEDGVMNEFFDYGHIVFNAGVEKAPVLPFPGEKESLRMAKSGGAGYLLEILVTCATENNGSSNEEKPEQPSLRDVTYQFTRVNSGEVLKNGKMPPKTAEADQGDLSFTLGRQIAQSVLQEWK